MDNAAPGERDRRISKALSQLSQLLVPDEKIESYAVQRRLGLITDSEYEWLKARVISGL